MIRKFIEDNNISFEEGGRNSAITVLIGYTLYLEKEKEDLEITLSKEISKDGFLLDEIDKLWGYCKVRNYGNFWKTEEAKSLYKF